MRDREASPPGDERRQHPRAQLAANVVVLKGEQRIGVYRVINLSAGGLMLAGDPALNVGDTVEVILRLGDRTVRAHASVLRETRTGHGGVSALAFRDLAADAHDLVQSAVLRALEDARGASVLIVDDSAEICQALRTQLGRLGLRAVAVGTPLEAVNFLEQPNHVTVALVDLVLGGSNGLDVLAYLADQHPNVRRVLMSGRAHPQQLELARHSLFRHSAHDVLPKPWTEETLTRAVAP
jgi:CheY-like chemotaxis protein